jgi:type II secretory pathway pseudopilin PulG
VTLLELIVATVILAIASLGALSYQYHAVKRAQNARAEIAAAQLAQLLLDDWKSTGGNEFYDPTELNLGLEQIGTDPVYRLVFNGFPMRAQLWYTDLDTDEEAGVTLREIRVAIRWRRDYKNLEPAASDPIFTSSTYVRRDQSGG